MANPWHKRFSTEEYIYGKKPNEFVVEAKRFLPKGKILCIAEGEGRNAVYLAEQGFDVTAWDYAQAGLYKTKKLAKEKGVEVAIKLVDLADVQWQEEQWDAIVHIFGHFPKPVMKRTMDGIKKALKPGGVYICELYSNEQLVYGTGGPKDIEMLCEPKMLLEHFQDLFIHHFYVGEVNRNEGKLHTGKAHVVQAAFQKPLN